MLGKVLKSNGTYTHISSIQTGDYVLNMKGIPVCVKSIEQVKPKRARAKLLQVTHKHWHEQLLIYNDTDMLVWNKHNSVLWKQTKSFRNLVAEQPDFFGMMPTEIQWDMPSSFDDAFGSYVIKPSYALGYLFGCFMRIGLVNDYGVITFLCSSEQDELVSKISHMGKEVFGYAPLQVDVSAKNLLYMSYPDDDIFKVFKQFQIKTHKDRGLILPHQYHCNNATYNKGIFDGLYDSQYMGHVRIHSIASGQ